jgi:hypothetical protein
MKNTFQKKCDRSCKFLLFIAVIEALRGLLRRIFDPQGIILFPIRSLTMQQATGNALTAGFKLDG